MKNSSASDESKGVIVFALNSAQVDYVAIADETSKLIEHTLGLPITLVTDHTSEPKFTYHKVIRIESQGGNYRPLHGEILEWRNFGRYLAYELSPYDTTLLIDTDYLVLDKNFLKFMDTNKDYQLVHRSHSPDQKIYQQMGPHGLDFVWATAVVFRKTTLSKQLFDVVGRIQRNYKYYRTLFNCDAVSYRNDYAFAIADIILNGYSEKNNAIPYSLFTLEQPLKSLETRGNFIIAKTEDSADVIAKQNIHVMDKRYLQSEEFKRFVEEIVQ